MLEIIRDAWGWIGLEPAEVVTQNSFGNLIVRDADECYWRICPEELSCEIVARNEAEFAVLASGEEFQTDWEMSRLVEVAGKKLGPLPLGYCYCLNVPAVIGGPYEAANMETITVTELISCSGDMAEQMKDVPDGARVTLKIRP